MIQTLAVLLIGFSVVGLAILLTAYLYFLPGVQKSRQGMSACAVLCLALAVLQLHHLHHFASGAEALASWHYVLLLFLTPAAFYFFSRDILLPDTRLSRLGLLHAVPPLLGLLLPAHLVAAAAFTIGAGYSIWLARLVHGMRRHVKRFRFEMFFFGLFAAIAVTVLAIVVAMPWIGSHSFYLVYAIAIGLGVALVNAALLVFPELLQDISEAAKLAYANSTLKGVDVDARLANLERLMGGDKLYCNENLTLSTLAESTGLSAHQLSELVNTRFGVGFSRYVRELRVAEAKRILAEDNRSSVLSVGMMCGFGSQSTFYAAFRDATGLSPAAFRKQLASADAPE
jgi:AraC-like DNA-binding protein